MERGTWVLMSMAYYIISFIVWFAVEGGNGCLVVPSAAAVIAGDNVSLICTSDTFTIKGWDRGSDLISKSNVYKAPVYNRTGSITEPSTIVYGYSVDDLADDRQVILIMNKASTVQADRYYCNCYPLSSSPASVTVLVSKPTVSITSQITDGGPVNILCSVSFNGTADSSLIITDVSGTKMAEKREAGAYPSTSNDLRVISLDYNTTADSNINQTYSCQVTLYDDTKTIYSEQIVTSVQWIPTQNVQIMADKTRCSNGSQCAINQTLNCTAEGNPYPVRFKWTGFLNGSQFSDDTSGLLNLTSVGNYTVQCTAFNTIGYIPHNSTSQFFKTEVTMEGPPTPLPDTHPGGSSKTSLIVGLVVGLGGGLILIIVSVIVLLIFWKRKKRGTVCCNPDGNDTSNNQSVELHKSHSDTNSASMDKGGKKNGHITPGVQNKDSDEVTVVDNTLYSGAQKAKQIDPSDGGYASINEVMTRGK